MKHLVSEKPRTWEHEGTWATCPTFSFKIRTLRSREKSSSSMLTRDGGRGLRNGLEAHGPFSSANNTFLGWESILTWQTGLWLTHRKKGLAPYFDLFCFPPIPEKLVPTGDPYLLGYVPCHVDVVLHVTDNWCGSRWAKSSHSRTSQLSQSFNQGNISLV